MIKENMTSIECLNKIESLIETISCKCEASYGIFGELRVLLDELNELDELKKELEAINKMCKELGWLDE